MAQQIVSWFVCDGRFRVHAINAVGRRKGRIVEAEEVDSGERFYGSARRLKCPRRYPLTLGAWYLQ
jgi:hypothetical protein